MIPNQKKKKLISLVPLQPQLIIIQILGEVEDGSNLLKSANHKTHHNQDNNEELR